MKCKEHPNHWEKGLSPSLLRRLAEAADGFRDKHETFYLVAKLTADDHGNHEVRGPFKKSEDLPPDLCQDIGEGRGWFGPFQGKGPKEGTLLVEEMDLALKTAGESPEHSNKKIPAHRFDCLAWSRSALEKFLVPYYARMYGGAYVDRLLTEFEADPLQMVGHLPGTEYEQVDAAGPAAAVGDGEPGPEELQPGIAVLIRAPKRQEEPEMIALLPGGGTRVL